MAESIEEISAQQSTEEAFAPVEIHGENLSGETLKKEDDVLSKSFENLCPNVAEASSSSSPSSSVGLEKNLSFSKLNAQAPEFIPRVQTPGPVQAIIQTPRPVIVEFTTPPPSVQLVEQQYEAEPTVASSSSKPLTDDLRQKVVKQVEFYFSDANLPTDKHLMKYVKKDPDGFVPISVVASFRKIKSLVSNHALVAAALRSSSELVVSEDGKKVRRLHPLPDIDIEEVQSRTIVAENLPSDYSIQNLEKLFGGVGNVKMVRVCDPHGYNESGPSSMRPSKNDMLVSNRLHALVEYQTVEQAEKAVMELNDGGNWRSGLQVQLLCKRMVKYGHQTKARKSDNADVHGEEDDTSNVPDAGNDKQTKASAHHSERHEDFEGDGHYSNDKNGGRRGRGRGRGKSRGRGQYHGNGRGHPVGTAASSNSIGSEVVVKQPPGPRMPDGTRGFTMGRGRPLLDSTV